MRLGPLALASLVTSLAAAGCSIQSHTASLEDNLVLFNLDNSNVLHTPYVAGSRFTITVSAGANATNDGWTLTSSDPTVLQIGQVGGADHDQFPVTAAGAGHATLTVSDSSGHVLDTADVDVAVPTRVALSEQGLLLAGYTDDEAAVGSAQVVSGGTATFLARYFDEDHELYGNNALTATDSAVALAAVTSTSFSVRDFVQVTGLTAGTASVHLAAGGAQLDLPVTVVDPTAVQSVTLLRQSESGASEGQSLYVFARALDANGQDVYGSSFAWTAQGVALPGYVNANDPTDLLSYQFHAAGEEMVAASVGGHAAEATVHGAPDSTSTSSSENVGCSVARTPGGPGSAAAAALGALALLAARRRARAASR